MGEAGILTDVDRVELIEGELVAMAPINSEHVAVTNDPNQLVVVHISLIIQLGLDNPLESHSAETTQPTFRYRSEAACRGMADWELSLLSI